MSSQAGSQALAALERAAAEADVAERRLRETLVEEIARRETERRRAYRRHSFLRALIAADAAAPDREASREAQRIAAAAELDWDQIDAARRPVLDALEPLADAVHDARLQDGAAEESPARLASAAAEAPVGGERIDLLLALASFEAWYEALRGQKFVEIFDRTLPETPLVDF